MIEKIHPPYRPRFPRSNSYDPEWMMSHQMGPNATGWWSGCPTGSVRRPLIIVRAGSKSHSLAENIQVVSATHLLEDFSLP